MGLYDTPLRALVARAIARRAGTAAPSSLIIPGRGLIVPSRGLVAPATRNPTKLAALAQASGMPPDDQALQNFMQTLFAPDEAMRTVQREGDRASRWLGDYAFRRWRTNEGNVVNPISGLKLFDDPRQGLEDIATLRSQGIRIHPFANPDTAAEHFPTIGRRGWWERKGTLPIPPDMQRQIYANLPYMEAIRQRKPLEPASILTHELAHYLTDATNNMHPSLWDYLNRIGRIVERKKDNSFSRWYDPPEAIRDVSGYRTRLLEKVPRGTEHQYTLDPTELYSRIMATRFLRDNTLPLPLRTTRDAYDLGTDAGELFEAVGPRLARHLLRSTPVLAGAGAGVGAAYAMNQHQDRGGGI